MKLHLISDIGLCMELDIEAKKGERIESLKNRCADNQLIRHDDVLLEYRGEVLDESLYLKDYRIKDGDTLKLIPKFVCIC